MSKVIRSRESREKPRESRGEVEDEVENRPRAK
jgi:hypothetical protein